MKPVALSLTLVMLTPVQASADTFGHCRFDTVAQAFAGTATEQAGCLLRKVRILGNVDPSPIQLPPNLARLVGHEFNPDKVKLRALIFSQGTSEPSLGGSLDSPVSRGRSNNPSAPLARYFVIHDTSTPNFSSKPFPIDLDSSNRVNTFSYYRSATNAKAHIFLNRRGEMYVGHSLGVPWRATKLESRIGVLSKGLFLHIENVQPRRAHPNQADGNAPEVGFSMVQYDRLALIYISASVRAGRGLIPAFHAAIDQGLSDGHDDPQNFSLEAFDAAIGKVVQKLQ
jgi:hypothetical protein